MSPSAIPLVEFEQEMAATRRLLERVPSESGAWKPHDKSFPLGHLAQLVARMPGWITNSLTEPHLDLGQYPGYSLETTDTLLAEFDDHVREAKAALAAVTGPALDEGWSLRHGDHVIFSAPRGAIVRNHLNHFIHHRGQLTVYLRLLDIPLPQIYGPTADEPW